MHSPGVLDELQAWTTHSKSSGVNGKRCTRVSAFRLPVALMAVSTGRAGQWFPLVIPPSLGHKSNGLGSSPHSAICLLAAPEQVVLLAESVFSSADCG